MRAPAYTLSAVLLILFALTAVLGNQPAPPAQAPAWDNCLACHTDPTATLPPLSAFRIETIGQPLVDCRDCHSEIDLAGIRSDLTHPVRSVGSHVECTDCHQPVAHNALTPPPVPGGDYHAEGCYSCHRDVEAKRMMLWSHGESPGIKCRDCHPPHKPLKAALPPDLLSWAQGGGYINSYDWWQSNDLCFECHVPADIMLPLHEGFVTKNTVNYHDLHLGRGEVLCIECHDPHGANREGMLRDQLLTGASLGYMDRIDGASCTVVCHGVDHDDWRYINEVF